MVNKAKLSSLLHDWFFNRVFIGCFPCLKIIKVMLKNAFRLGTEEKYTAALKVQNGVQAIQKRSKTGNCTMLAYLGE